MLHYLRNNFYMTVKCSADNMLNVEILKSFSKDSKKYKPKIIN